MFTNLSYRALSGHLCVPQALSFPFLILSPFPHSLSISSFSHFLFIFSFPPICSQPGCQDATSCATLVCPNQSFRPPSWSSLPEVVNGLFVSPNHDGDGLVDLDSSRGHGELVVTRGGHRNGRPHTMGLFNTLLRWSGCPP